MTNIKQEITDLVNDFAASLHAAWVRAATHALGGIDEPDEVRGERVRVRPSDADATSPKRGNQRAKGEKRPPDEIEELGKRFIAYVRKNPGLRIEQINKAIGTTTKDLALPIRKGVAEGVLIQTGEKRSTTYSAKR
jgi:hypothetical protein